MDVIETLRRKFNRMKAELDERACRVWAATEALELGHGGIQAVAEATGLGERTVRRGCEQLREGQGAVESGVRRIRKAGGGRKAVTERDPDVLGRLEALVEPSTRGDPMSPLRWTCKSTRKLAQALTDQGHGISHTKVAQLLEGLDYSLQSTRKNLEGASHPDRDAHSSGISTAV